MVYCGKPSKGCQMCRTRRIKCDETKPTCLQCQKSRRQCPGYKDDFDLVFRNETEATEKRARKSISKAKAKNAQEAASTFQFHEPQLSSSNQSSSNSIMKPFAPDSQVSVPAGLGLPIEQLATQFFYANYVIASSNVESRGFWDYIIPLMNTESSNSVLKLAFNAVSLAALGNRPNAKQLLVKAENAYARAISEVNQALRDPRRQTSDSTLSSVLLLGLFESILSRRTTMTAWGSHIQGAVMLTKLRGKKALRTKIGHALYVSVRLQMIINCLITSSCPTSDLDWWLSDPGCDPSLEISRLGLKTADLRAEINKFLTVISRTPENIAHVLSLMQRAFTLEQEVQAWIDNASEYWQPKIVAWVDDINGETKDSEVFPGKVLVYNDFWVLTMYNLLRVSKLFLAGAIIRCAAWVASPVDYRTTPEYATAARWSVDIINDIVASVPYVLGWGRDDFNTKYSVQEGFACGSGASLPRAIGAYVCVWPLFSATCSDFTTDRQREWMFGRLQYIEKDMGINQAGTLRSYFLRLPSMIVKRDFMTLAALSNPAAYAAYASAMAGAAALKAGSNSTSPSTSMHPSNISSSPSTISPPSTSPSTLPIRNSQASTYPQAPVAISYNLAAAASSSLGAPYNKSAISTSTSPSTFPTAPTTTGTVTASPVTTASTPSIPIYAAYFANPEDPQLVLARQEADRMQRDIWKAQLAMQKKAQKEVLERKKEELIELTSGGYKELEIMMERYFAVGLVGEGLK